jgi:hypothetical protein
MVAGTRTKAYEGKDPVTIVSVLQRFDTSCELVDVTLPKTVRLPEILLDVNGTMPEVEMLCEVRLWKFEGKSGLSVHFLDMLGGAPKGVKK